MNTTLLGARVGFPMFRALVRCFELLVLFALLVLAAVNRLSERWEFMIVLLAAVIFYVINEYWLPLITS